MNRFDLLLDLLKASLEKNGNKEITVLHLINIMEMVNRQSVAISERIYKDCMDAISDGWGR